MEPSRRLRRGEVEGVKARRSHGETGHPKGTVHFRSPHQVGDANPVWLPNLTVWCWIRVMDGRKEESMRQQRGWTRWFQTTLDHD